MAVNKGDYLKNMDALLNDNATYTIVNKDPTKKLIRNLHELLVRWKKRKYITNAMYKKLNCIDEVSPRAYGMPKIHKQGSSLRIIISSKNSPLYELATFLHETMHGSIPSSNKQISNSYQLVDKLTNTYI